MGGSANTIRSNRMANGPSASNAANGPLSTRSWLVSGRNNMFDLDEAVSRWRHQMAADGIHRQEILDELESHLRDDMEHRKHTGLTLEQAFEAAAKALGE